MTLDEALEILNQHKHDGKYWIRNRWTPAGPGAVGTVCDQPDVSNTLTEFEAIAVAEKYRREDPNEALESLRAMKLALKANNL